MSLCFKGLLLLSILLIVGSKAGFAQTGVVAFEPYYTNIGQIARDSAMPITLNIEYGNAGRLDEAHVSFTSSPDIQCPSSIYLVPGSNPVTFILTPHKSGCMGITDAIPEGITIVPLDQGVSTVYAADIRGYVFVKGAKPAQLKPSTALVDFGTVLLGASRTKSFTLQRSNDSGEVNKPIMSGLLEPFSADSLEEYYSPCSASVNFRFEPKSEGMYFDTVLFVDPTTSDTERTILTGKSVMAGVLSDPLNLIALVYPNPAHNAATIVFSQPEARVTIRIFDDAGKICQEEHVKQGVKEFKFGTTRLSPGAYTVTVQTTHGTASHRLEVR